MLTKEYVLSVFDYNPELGKFYWKGGRSRTVAGKEAGSLKPSGYIIIKLDGKEYRAHHLVWLVETGIWPTQVIDHKDRVRHNNRFSNLQDVSVWKNNQNTCMNTSGRVGVYFEKPRGKWKASIEYNGKRYQERFDTYEEACNWRKDMESKIVKE